MQLDTLLAGVRDNRVEDPTASLCSWDPGSAFLSAACGEAADSHAGSSLYRNRDASLGIDFEVIRLPFSGLQVMDPRLVRIAPGSRNEKHRHAHESIFVVLSGQGEIQIGSGRTPLEAGHVAYVPRWVVHQSHNLCSREPLLLLAITDFGLTSAVLGDYDASTRLRRGGANSDPAAGPVSLP
jgi:uncharacterized RmlC-like cupin family protein